MKILMLETMTYGDDISLEQFNRLGEVVTYSLSSYEEAVARMKEHNPDVRRNPMMTDADMAKK
jgi:glycerate dehydrogenase